VVRRLARDSDIATQVDQNSAVQRGRDPYRRSVGRQGLGRRPQVEHDFGGDLDFAPVAVQLHRLPPRRRYRRL